MSKTRNQSLAIVVLVSVSMKSAELNNIAGSYMPAITYMSETAEKTMVALWQGLKSKRKGVKGTNWVISRMDNISDELNEVAEEFDLVCVVSLCQMMLDDVRRKVKNRRKRASLNILAEAVDGLSDLLDPKGDHYKAYEAAEEMMQIIYREFEFNYQK